MFSFCNFAELFFLLCWRLFSSPVLIFLWFSGLFRVSARFFPSSLSTILIPVFITSRGWMFFILFSWLGPILSSKILTVLISVFVLIFRERISSLSSFLSGIPKIMFQIHVHFLVSVLHGSAVAVSLRRKPSVWSVLCYGIFWISVSGFLWPPFSLGPRFLMPLLWSPFFLFPIIRVLFPDQFIYFFPSVVPLPLLSYIFICMCKMKYS